MKRRLLIIILSCTTLAVFGQQHKTDSLRAVLKLTSDYPKRIAVLKQLADRQNDASIIIEYSDQGIQLAKKSNKPYDQEYFLVELEIGYFKIYNYPKFLEACFAGLELSQQLQDNKNTVKFLDGISIGYGAGNENRKAIYYALKGLHIAEQTNDKSGLSSLCGNISNYYMSLKLMDSALYYSMKSYRIALAINAPTVAYPLMNLAATEDSLHHPAVALSYFRQALTFIKKRDFLRNRNLMNVYAGIARIYQETAQPDSAFYYARMGYQLAEQDNDLDLKYQTASLLSTLYEGKNDKESLRYYKIATTTRESIFSADRAKQFQILLAKEQAKREELLAQRQKEREEQKENLQLSGIALFIPFFLLSALLLSRTNTHRKIIEFMSVLSLLLVFEFITLWIHPYIEELTNHTPVLEYLILVAMAAVLVPLHHNLTHWLREKLVHSRDKKQTEEPGGTDTEVTPIGE
jgi:hypothetical protein